MRSKPTELIAPIQIETNIIIGIEKENGKVNERRSDGFDQFLLLMYSPVWLRLWQRSSFNTRRDNPAKLVALNDERIEVRQWHQLHAAQQFEPYKRLIEFLQDNAELVNEILATFSRSCLSVVWCSRSARAKKLVRNMGGSPAFRKVVAESDCGHREV